MKRRFNNQYFTLRHGQTTQQTKGKKFTYKWPDIPPVKLTKKGEAQIRKAAKKLKKEKIDLIYSSDIYRTRQTSQIVAKELKLEVSFNKRLRDINLGIYHGKLKEGFYKDFPDRKKRFYMRPEQGESWNDCKERMLNFIKDLEKKHKNKTILIISHGDPLWLLSGAVKGFSSKRLLKELFNGNFVQVGELRKIV